MGKTPEKGSSTKLFNKQFNIEPKFYIILKVSIQGTSRIRYKWGKFITLVSLSLCGDTREVCWMFPEHHFFPWLMSARIWLCYCNGKVVINFAKLRRLIIHLSSISLTSMPISDPEKCWLHDWCCHWLSSCVSRQVSEQVGTSLIRIFSVQMCALNFKIKIFLFLL